VVIVAAADGSALGNPGPAGWAWYVDDDHWAAGGWPHGTNNQGELKAVIDLFQSTAHLDDAELHVLCDSQYVINTVTKWMPGWKRRGWRKADGAPVLNVDLIKELDEAIAGRRYRFEWVKGHAGHSLNEAADLRARAVATAYQAGRPVPAGPGWGGTISAAPGRRATEPDIVVLQDDADVLAREQLLLDPEIRRDRARVEELLHPAFEEFGASGRVWSREAMLEAIADPVDPDLQFRVIGLNEVSPGAMLVAYTTTTSRGTVLRSSLWLKTESGWRLRFHQGTPAAAGDSSASASPARSVQAAFDF
jgi:ribonuclease HI